MIRLQSPTLECDIRRTADRGSTFVWHLLVIRVPGFRMVDMDFGTFDY